MRVLASQAQGKPATTNDNAVQSDFSALLKQSINKVNEGQLSTEKLATAFHSAGPNVQVSEVMVALQKSNVSFQAQLVALLVSGIPSDLRRAGTLRLQQHLRHLLLRAPDALASAPTADHDIETGDPRALSLL